MARTRIGKDTELVDGGPLVVSATTSAPTKGTGIVVDKVWWQRRGSRAYVRMEYRHTVAGAAGSGDYLFKMPANLKIDTNKHTVYTTVEGFNSNFLNNNGLGICQGGNGANQFFGNISVYDQDYVRFVAEDGSSNTQGFIGSAGYQLSTTNVFYVAEFEVYIQGWTESD